MLTLGLPKRPKAEGSPNTMAARLATKRPSLAGVSNVDLNVRRGQRELYRCTSFVGLVGVLTGQRTGGFSL